MKTIIKNLLSLAKSVKLQTLIFLATFLPMFAFSQSSTETGKSENIQLTSQEEISMPAQTGRTKSNNQKWSDENRYNVEKRNKKASKKKVEQCEINQSIKGTSKREAKEVCKPKK